MQLHSVPMARAFQRLALPAMLLIVSTALPAQAQTAAFPMSDALVGRGSPNGASLSAADANAIRLQFERQAREVLGLSEDEAKSWAERQVQRLRDELAQDAVTARDAATETAIAEDATEDEAKRDTVATGREDPGIGVRVRDTKQNGLKAEIARDAAERSGAAGKLKEKSGGVTDSLAPQGAVSPKACDATGAAVGTPQKPARITSAEKRAMAEAIIAEANRQGVDPALALSVAYHEGGFDPNARGADGEIGTFQLMAGTAEQLGVTNRTDPAQNIWGGIKYLKAQLARFGNIRQALAAYNGGPGIVRPNGTYSNTQYPERVLAHYDSFRQQLASGELGKGTGSTGLDGLVTEVSASSDGIGCDQRLKDAMDENTRARAQIAAVQNQRLEAQTRVLASLILRRLKELQLQSAFARATSDGDRTDWETVKDADPTRVDCPPELAARGNVSCFVLPRSVSQERLLAWLTTLQDLARATGSSAAVELTLIDGKSTAIVTTTRTDPGSRPAEANLPALSDPQPSGQDSISALLASSDVTAAELEAALAASRATAR